MDTSLFTVSKSIWRDNFKICFLCNFSSACRFFPETFLFFVHEELRYVCPRTFVHTKSNLMKSLREVDKSCDLVVPSDVYFNDNFNAKIVNDHKLSFSSLNFDKFSDEPSLEILQPICQDLHRFLIKFGNGTVFRFLRIDTNIDFYYETCLSGAREIIWWRH